MKAFYIGCWPEWSADGPLDDVVLLLQVTADRAREFLALRDAWAAVGGLLPEPWQAKYEQAGRNWSVEVADYTALYAVDPIDLEEHDRPDSDSWLAVDGVTEDFEQARISGGFVRIFHGGLVFGGWHKHCRSEVESPVLTWAQVKALARDERPFPSVNFTTGDLCPAS